MDNVLQYHKCDLADVVPTAALKARMNTNPSLIGKKPQKCRLIPPAKGLLFSWVQSPSYAIGQAVFIRTDTPDYAEETIPFKNLDELVRICAMPREHLTLDKVLMYSMVEGEPHSLMLSFLSSSKGQQPGMPFLQAQE